MQHPLLPERFLPVIADSHVDMNFGTGQDLLSSYIILCLAYVSVYITQVIKVYDESLYTLIKLYLLTAPIQEKSLDCHL